MARALLVLAGDTERRKAQAWVRSAPVNTRVEFKEAKRSVPQNDKMWALLTDIATQHAWHGQRLSPNDWKKLFMAALGEELRLVPNLEGTGFVSLGRSSSDLDKQEMSELIELMLAWGANPEHPVKWTEPVETAA